MAHPSSNSHHGRFKPRTIRAVPHPLHVFCERKGCARYRPSRAPSQPSTLNSRPLAFYRGLQQNQSSCSRPAGSPACLASAPYGAAQVSPARKCWVRNTNTTQRRRCDTNSWRSPLPLPPCFLARRAFHARPGATAFAPLPKSAWDSFSNLKFPISNRSWPAAAGSPTLVSAPDIADGRTLMQDFPHAANQRRLALTEEGRRGTT